MGHSFQIFGRLTESSLIIHNHLTRISKPCTVEERGGLDLQHQAKSCPGKCSMGRIILHSSVANCYEFLNPIDDLLNHVSENNGLATWLLECQAFLHADLPFLLGFFQGLREYISMLGL